MRAVTDSGPTEPNQSKPEAIENLFTMLRIMSTPDAYNFFDEQYNNCTIRYGDLKKHLAEEIVHFTDPIRNRILELGNNEQYISKVARLGAEKARESGRKTVNEVREIIGFKSF